MVDDTQLGPRNLGTVRESRSRLSTVHDITLVYPDAVVACSDTLGWQNIRVIHLHHTFNELVV